MRDMPGPGEYKYNNMNVGVDARKFSFLQRTKNVYGKCQEYIKIKASSGDFDFYSTY